MIKVISSTLFLIGYFSGCGTAQDRSPDSAKLIGSCEGCEAVFEYKDEGLRLSNVDSLPEFGKKGEPLKISGVVYKPGGKEPAGDVILYIHHTNEEGIYPKRGNEKGWARRHGYLRGWIKTGDDGRYTFYTIKPGSYPQRSSPAHIHITVLEPDGKYYWLQDHVFEDDPLLKKGSVPANPRGGSSGVLKLEKEGEMWVAERDIELGKNVED